MRERSCTVLSFLFLLAVSFVPAASALEADPEIVAAQDALSLPGVAGASFLKPDDPVPKGRASGLLNEVLIQN